MAAWLGLCATGVLCAGCSSPSDSPAGMQAWAHSASFSSTTSLLDEDLSEISTGLRLHELKATRTACDGLGDDAASAIGQLPTPDHRVTVSLNAAYSGLVNAAQACSTASSLGSPALLRYRKGAAHATAQLAAARRRVDQLEGKS